MYKTIGGAMVMVVQLLLFLIVSLILIFFKKSKPVGQGVLIGTAITLLIGFGICSLV